MGIPTAAITPSVDSRDGGADHDRGRPTDAPDALIRTMDGRVTFWSLGMQKRYGFTSGEALGRISHELLQTGFPHTLKTIEAALVDRGSWIGGLIHHRADGATVMAANHWHIHRDLNGQAVVITEIHSDIASAGIAACGALADLLAALAHELSEPLTTISSCLSSARRLSEPGQSDPGRLREVVLLAASQIERGTASVRLLRDLAAGMRHNA
jgi:signal transduction histidine kinase